MVDWANRGRRGSPISTWTQGDLEPGVSFTRALRARSGRRRPTTGPPHLGELRADFTTLSRKKEQKSASSSLSTHPLRRCFYQHLPERGGYKVSEGEVKVSQWRGLSRYGFLFSFSHQNAWDQSIDQVTNEAIIRLTLTERRKLRLNTLRSGIFCANENG
jgi:hypothetical protein